MGANTQRTRWLVVAGSAIALIVSNGPVLLFTFAVFLRPISEEYGWSRGTMSLGVTLGLLLGGLATPVVGILIDRWSIKRVTLGCITLFSASFALLSLAPPNVAVFVAIYALSGLFASGQAPLPYAKAISGWFDASRGLALGIAMAGIGIGIAVMPQVAQALVHAFGWRKTYALLGLMTWLVAFPAVLFLVHDPAPHRHPAAAGRGESGIDGSAAMRAQEFWLIVVASFLVVTAVNGISTHLVALLVDKGMAAATAAPLLATVGLATIAGRLVSGYLLDRIFAPNVAAAIFLLPVVGIAILFGGLMAPIYVHVAAICVGFSLGAEVDIIGFLVGRYFGLRRYGQIYGYMFAAFTIGSGLGPFIMGLSFDRTGGYEASLAGFVVALLAASFLIARLGEYKYLQPAA